MQGTGKMSPVAGLFSEVQDEVLTDCVFEAMVRKDGLVRLGGKAGLGSAVPWLVVCYLTRVSLMRLPEELPPLLLLWRVLCAALLVGRCLLGAVLRWVMGPVKVAAPLLGSPLLS